MRSSPLINRILILVVGCLLTLSFSNTCNADGCWGSSRGSWGSGGASFGSRGGLFSNAPVRNLLWGIGDRVGAGLTNLGNGIVNVLERKPLRNALFGSNGSSWGGSRGSFASGGNGFGGGGGLAGGGSTGGWGSGSSWDSFAADDFQASPLLSAPAPAPEFVSAPAYLAAPAPEIFAPAPVFEPAVSLLDLPIITTGGFGSAGSVSAYTSPSFGYADSFGHADSFGPAIDASFASPLDASFVSPLESSLFSPLDASFAAPIYPSIAPANASPVSQFETSAPMLDYGFYGTQFGDIGIPTDSVIVDGGGGLITGPMLEQPQGSPSNSLQLPSGGLDLPDFFDGGGPGSEEAPGDAFGAEEDDSVYLPRSKAVLSLDVPRKAKVYINDKLTRTKGIRRTYVSRNLAFGQEYRYRVRVVSEIDGKPVTKTHEITMRGGENEQFAFNFDPIVTRVVLNVPRDAKVKIDGKETSPTGSFRSFSTRKLTSGKWEDYSVEVTVVRDGKTLTKRESFDLGAGEFRFFEFDFGQAAAANVAAK